ncbi:L,D-transpeptidase [Sandaracinus amylolyticus]|uniref:L,D-transpeptidase n=1 Tax=Sandaracinus amylolyticus TaxID=927083 RepID=UPI00069F7700|nr:L,D-transpeptidase [Sandaracinus amylolyticus]
MRRNLTILVGIVAIVGLATAGLSAIAGHGPSGASATTEIARAPDEPLPEPTSEEERAAREREHQAMLDRDYPLHGLVTKTQLVVRARPEPEANIEGWLRVGSHLRLKRESTRTPTCASGWYELWPRGFACAGLGVDVTETAPEHGREVAPDLESALPYHYYFVKEPQVPEWHQLPSRDDQRAAIAHATRYLEFLRDDERRAARLRAGELANEPGAPREVARWLDHGFWIASNATEVRSQRRFVRTVRGSYVKEAQLEERTGSQFHGVELDETRTLPIAWTVRAARPLARRDREDGTTRLIEVEGEEAIERLEVVPWQRRERIGDRIYHVVDGPNGEVRYLRDWFVAVAERRDPPAGVAAHEPWVHVDLSAQTLVVYRGPTPIYATLVSSGVEGHVTPIGEFTIRRKFVTDTMADLGPEAGDDRYRIEDVPWTQYFDGSIALHAAFWHGQFGITRSHGCVNLAPRDAQWVFQHTWPEVPDGWHGVSTEGTGVRGSRVIVTE